MDTQKIIAETHQNAWNAQNNTLQVKPPQVPKHRSQMRKLWLPEPSKLQRVYDPQKNYNNSTPNYETDTWRKTPSQQEHVT